VTVVTVASPALLLFLLLPACGSEDSLLTGLSGFIILCIVVLVIWRYAKRRS
jgi:hypothetical protein